MTQPVNKLPPPPKLKTHDYPTIIDQKALKDLGLLRKITGEFDAPTKRAIKKFQKLERLKESGELNESTRELLNVRVRELLHGGSK